MQKIAIGLNEAGRRVGISHPAAKLTDHDVELMCALRDEGLSYGAIARKMGVCKEHAVRVTRGDNRAQTAVRFKFL